jgi:hypothetical protein
MSKRNTIGRKERYKPHGTRKRRSTIQIYRKLIIAEGKSSHPITKPAPYE